MTLFLSRHPGAAAIHKAPEDDRAADRALHDEAGRGLAAGVHGRPGASPSGPLQPSVCSPCLLRDLVGRGVIEYGLKR